MKKKKTDFKNKPTTRSLRELARLIMRLPSNRDNADKLCVYESQRIYTSYFREVHR